MYQDLNNGHILILLWSFTDTILDSVKYFSTYQHKLVLLSEREQHPSKITLLNKHFNFEKYKLMGPPPPMYQQKLLPTDSSQLTWQNK
jgi:hypothetical protein